MLKKERKKRERVEKPNHFVVRCTGKTKSMCEKSTNCGFHHDVVALVTRLTDNQARGSMFGSRVQLELPSPFFLVDEIPHGNGEGKTKKPSKYSSYREVRA